MAYARSMLRASSVTKRNFTLIISNRIFRYQKF
jgi:hypothetical protein